MTDISRALDASAQAINCANVNAFGLENPEGIARAAIVAFLRALPESALWGEEPKGRYIQTWQRSSSELADAIEAEAKK